MNVFTNFNNVLHFSSHVDEETSCPAVVKFGPRAGLICENPYLTGALHCLYHLDESEKHLIPPEAYCSATTLKGAQCRKFATSAFGTCSTHSRPLKLKSHPKPKKPTKNEIKGKLYDIGATGISHLRYNSLLSLLEDTSKIVKRVTKTCKEIRAELKNLGVIGFSKKPKWYLENMLKEALESTFTPTNQIVVEALDFYGNLVPQLILERE